MKKRGQLRKIEDQTLTRRSLLDWMGKATVIGLGGGLVASCVDEYGALADAGTLSNDGGDDPSAGPHDDTKGNDTDPADDDTASEPEVASCETFDGNGFEPGQGTHEVFEKWGERTVDPQEIEQVLKSWRLRVDGLVEKPVDLSFAELLALPSQDQLTDFHCVEGWSIHDVPWNGVHLKTLFDIVRPQPGATHVTLHTLGDKYNESLPIEVASEPKTLLAYGIDCSTLPLKHGFPLRLIVPRMYAYKSPKYVYRIELADAPVSGYWVAAGYPYDAPVSESRLRPGKY